MMHPEIIKFWNEMGSIGITHINDSMCFHVVSCPQGDISSNMGNWQTVAKELNGEIIEYYYGNKIFSEKDMLRIIKLKAFL